MTTGNKVRVAVIILVAAVLIADLQPTRPFAAVVFIALLVAVVWVFWRLLRRLKTNSRT